MIQPESERIRPVFRRRRTRKYRRAILVRNFALAGITACLVLGLSAVVLRHFTPSLFQARQVVVPNRDQAEAARARLAAANKAQEEFRPRVGRPVYPYSVVPGGVEDVHELKWVADHDPVVASHYAGFDYDHARIVRLTLARTVYLSYRIGNHVYWTRRRVTLHPGEKILTDGRKSVRARCGNRVEDAPQVEVSTLDPPVWKFDEPMPNFEGTAVQEPPVPFQSALNHPPGEPGSPLNPYNPFNGGTWTPIAPPPLPVVCAPEKKGEHEGDNDDDDKPGKKKHPCSSGGGSHGTVPEPGTWLMIVTGAGLMYWQARRRFAPMS